MKMKKTLKIIGIILLMLIVFREIIFRSVIKYNAIGTRPEIEIISENLIEKINSKIVNREIDAKSIIEIANKITRDELQFSTGNVSSNPNELINTNKANCVGYSAMFNSISNYVIRMNNLQNEISSEHKIGQIIMFGNNLHQYFENPFFKDHDFNEITDNKTGEKILIDPSVSDLFWIDRISSKK